MKKKYIVRTSIFMIVGIFILSVTFGFFAKANNAYEIKIKPNGKTEITVLEGKETFYTLFLPKSMPEKWQGKIEADSSLGLSGDLIEHLNDSVKVLDYQELGNKDVIVFESSEEVLEIGITATKKQPMLLNFSFETGNKKVNHEITVSPTEGSLFAERLSLTKSTDKIPDIPAEALDIDLVDYFGIVGDASVSTEYPNTLIPVPDSFYQKGAMWSHNKINLKRDFSMEMFVYLHEMNGKGLADGITVTFQNDPRGVEAIGGSGAGIGAYPVNHRGDPDPVEAKYIENAISAEFDPHINEGAEDDYDKHPNIDGKPHIAIVRPKPQEEMREEISRSHAEFGDPINYVNFDVPRWNVVTAYWTAETERLRIGFEELQKDGSYVEVAAIDSHLENHEQLFGGSYVHWGMTGSTGLNKGAYYIAMKKMPEIDLGEPITDVINLSEREKFGEIGSNSETIVEDEDRVEYRLHHLIDGNNTIAKLKNYKIEDELPKGVVYEPGSTTYSHRNTDTNELISEGKVPDKSWNNNKLEFIMPEEVREDSEIIIHYEARFHSNTYKKEELQNDWAYTTTNGFGQKSTQATLIKEREAYVVTEQFVDEEGIQLAGDEDSEIMIEKNNKTWFKREPKEIEGYELESYSYTNLETQEKKQVDYVDGQIEIELTGDTNIIYHYRLADFSPRVNLRTKNNKLLIHYRNVDELQIFVNDEAYKTIKTEPKMSDETITLPLRVDSDRTKIRVEGRREGEADVFATLNDKKK